MAPSLRGEGPRCLPDDHHQRGTGPLLGRVGRRDRREINFVFPSGQRGRGRILESVPDARYRIEYLDGSIVTFALQADRSGGTDLTLTDEGVPEELRTEVIAGWVSVLLALKAAVDFNIDLRNHDRHRTWNDGYANN